LRSGDLDRVLAQIVAQHVGDARTEIVVDALDVVDVNGELGGTLQLHREHLDAGNGRLDLGADLALQRALPLICRRAHPCSFNKNGRSAPISSCR
jgi:hypothetical protein